MTQLHEECLLNERRPTSLSASKKNQRDIIKKPHRRLGQKVILPGQANFDTPLDRTVAAMVRHVTQQVLEGRT